jgi:hypothetical protein
MFTLDRFANELTDYIVVPTARLPWVEPSKLTIKQLRINSKAIRVNDKHRKAAKK